MKYEESVCKYNMDTGCVELLLRDGRRIFIDCTEVEDALDVTMAQQTELDYRMYRQFDWFRYSHPCSVPGNGDSELHYSPAAEFQQIRFLQRPEGSHARFESRVYHRLSDGGDPLQALCSYGPRLRSRPVLPPVAGGQLADLLLELLGQLGLFQAPAPVLAHGGGLIDAGGVI